MAEVAAARAEIVACQTCGGAAREPDGRTRGEHLLERLELERAARGASRVDVASVRCLWACKRSCAVMLRSPGRPGYVLVELEPSEGSARALFDYAELYLRAPDGAVPYKTWPDALKGHFLCRIPPEVAAPPDLALPPESASQEAARPLIEPDAPERRAPPEPAP